MISDPEPYDRVKLNQIMIVVEKYNYSRQNQSISDKKDLKL